VPIYLVILDGSNFGMIATKWQREISNIDKLELEQSRPNQNSKKAEVNNTVEIVVEDVDGTSSSDENESNYQ